MKRECKVWRMRAISEAEQSGKRKFLGVGEGARRGGAPEKRFKRGAGETSGRADVVEPSSNEVADSVSTALSISGGSVQERTVEVLKQKLEEAEQEKNELMIKREP